MAAVEQRLAALEGGSAAVAVAAGGALMATAFQPLMRPGDRLIVAAQVSAALARTLADTVHSFGWEVVGAAIDDPASFERAITPRSQAILVPSVAASGEVADIEALAQLAKRAGVPLIVDNTIASPALCRPGDFGADIVLHADARLLAGEASGIGFIVDGGRFNWMASRRYPAMTGSGPGDPAALAEAVGNFAYATACRGFAAEAPWAPASALLAGIETLPLRMTRHADTARVVATYLAGHRRVAAVAHAGLPGDRHHALAARYCPAGPGAVVAFAVEGGAEFRGGFRCRAALDLHRGGSAVRRKQPGRGTARPRGHDASVGWTGGSGRHHRRSRPRAFPGISVPDTRAPIA